MRATINKKDFEDIWNNGIITFDTCSLGRMYEWEYNEAINIKDSISYLLSEEKIWESSYNYEEFNVQRTEIKNNIFNQKYELGIFKNLKKSPIPWSKIDRTLNRWEGKGYSDSFLAELDEYRLCKHIDKKYIDQLRKLAKNMQANINIDDIFSSMFSNSDNMLSKEDEDKLKELYNSDKVCPGSCDKMKNNGKKYNDLFIWESIKRKSIMIKKDIIFVTCDIKTDWFVNGLPRPEYIQEFKSDTGNNIIILTLTEFWEYCRPYIDVQIDDFILQSTIREQLHEKYDDCYKSDICEKVEEMVFESDDIKSALEDSVDCCVDMPVLDQIENCEINDIYPEPYQYGEESVEVNINMQIEITFDAQNHTAGEDWCAGSGLISFDLIAVGSIPVKWSSDDTDRIVLEDSINVDEIIELSVNGCLSNSEDEEYSDDEYYNDEYSDDEEYY